MADFDYIPTLLGINCGAMWSIIETARGRERETDRKKQLGMNKVQKEEHAC